jgi:xylulokinase
VFCKTLASVAGVTIELYNTDGAQGAARAAAVGAGIVPHLRDAFKGLAALQSIEPDTNKDDYLEAYNRWHEPLQQGLSS